MEIFSRFLEKPCLWSIMPPKKAKKLTAKRRGGARKGAGRPLSGDRPKTRINISVDIAVLDRVRKRGINISGACEDHLRKLADLE